MGNLSLNIEFKRNDFSLSIKEKIPLKGITIISGASGVGKTTLLRSIAGFEKDCYGSIQYQNQVWQNSKDNLFTPAYLRKIGYIFQETCLFPNLNVFDNIHYGAKRKLDNYINIKDIIKILKIEHLLYKKVFEISGGEKQKIALARTLANAPRFILMDEPLSSIDEACKNDIIVFLNNFKQQYNIPIIYVTHCPIEKEKLGDSEYILKNGSLFQNIKKSMPNTLQEFSYYKRYQKQFNLREFGAQGQKQLLNTKFLCIGAGGLGSPVCLYLSSAGAGHIGIVDDDLVELSNLHRQVLYNLNSIGKEKANEAFENIKKINPDIEIELFKEKISSKNAENIIKNYDIVIDCTDNFASNYLLADVCVKLNKPLVYSSVNEFEGQISVFSNMYGGCFRCVFKNYPKHHFPNCNTSGVLGPACGILGSMQALQAIYLALGNEHCTKNKLNILYNQILKIDLKYFNVTKFLFNKNINCELCSKKSNEIIISDYEYSCLINNDIPELFLHEIENLLHYIFIDAREEIEFKLSHINNAINIPLSTLIKNKANLNLNKETPTIVYCQGNSRSTKAIEILKSHGFKNLIKLKGGFESYIENSS